MLNNRTVPFKNNRSRVMWILVIFLTLIILSPGSIAQTNTMNLELSIGSEGVNGFCFAMGSYYNVPQTEIVIIKQSGIPNEEMPVVFFIAKKARVTPKAVIDLRRRNMSWLEITLHFGLSPDIYYVPVTTGRYYRNSYGYYMNTPKKQWNKIIFKDSDIIDLVNLKFISEHYKYTPNDVIKMRENGKNFVVINDEVKKGRNNYKVKNYKGNVKVKVKGKGKK